MQRAHAQKGSPCPLARQSSESACFMFSSHWVWALQSPFSVLRSTPSSLKRLNYKINLTPSSSTTHQLSPEQPRLSKKLNAWKLIKRLCRALFWLSVMYGEWCVIQKIHLTNAPHSSGYHGLRVAGLLSSAWGKKKAEKMHYWKLFEYLGKFEPINCW